MLPVTWPQLGDSRLCRCGLCGWQGKHAAVVLMGADGRWHRELIWTPPERVLKTARRWVCGGCGLDAEVVE